MSLLLPMLMTILSFAKVYWLDIILTVGFFIFILWLYKRGKVNLIKRIIYCLVIQAEQQLGSKTGELKYNYVITALYSRLPIILQILFTKAQINRSIEESVQKLKEYLNNNDTDLLNYGEEKLKPPEKK